jgi:uncharacterized membrane-anchored protein
VFREKLTGTTADRPQLQKLITKLAPGDVVIIPAVDRLSRDTTDLLIIAREMQKAGAGIRSLAEPFLDTTSDFDYARERSPLNTPTLLDVARLLRPHNLAVVLFLYVRQR